MRIHIAEGLQPEWESILERNPLPSEGLAIAQDQSEDDAIISLYSVDWEKAPPQIPEKSRDSQTKVLKTSYFAPTIHIWDRLGENPTDISDLPLHPLVNIKPPLRALPVRGLYPGESGYPYTRRLVLRLDIVSPDGIPINVEEWMQGIPPAPPVSRIVWIAAVGDVMPGRGVDRILAGTQGDREVFGDLLPIMQKADLLIGNLEGAVTTGGSRRKKSYTFRFDPRTVEDLRNAGFDYLSLTNNHSYDFGEEGFIDSLMHLESAGIGTSGAGLSPEEAAEPWKWNRDDLEVRILAMAAYPPERNGFNGRREMEVNETRPGILWIGEAAVENIGESFGPESFDIVLVHGGEEWALKPDFEQIELYRSLIDAGADAVVGSHSHVFQGIESYGGGIIAYSLGNYVFPGMEETKYGEDSAILLMGIWRGSLIYLNLTPVKIDGRRLSIDTSRTIVRRIQELSRELQAR